jgi:hypothetical protein
MTLVDGAKPIEVERNAFCGKQLSKKFADRIESTAGKVKCQMAPLKRKSTFCLVATSNANGIATRAKGTPVMSKCLTRSS